MACAEISEKADAGNETCPWETSAEMVQGVRYGGADVPRRVSRPFEPQLSALGGQPETVQPEMQSLYVISKTGFPNSGTSMPDRVLEKSMQNNTN